MITEDYVSFETARLLKEKGFNEKLLTFYLTAEDKKEGCFQIMTFTDDKIDNNHSDYCYLAPTLQMAMKWLREVHNLHVDSSIYTDTDGDSEHEYTYTYWDWLIFNSDSGRRIAKPQIGCGRYDSYEQACEAAIKYCLAWLEKQGEQQDVNIQINSSEYINDIGGNGCYLKSTDKIEPKFKVGDWIVYNRDNYSREIIQVYDIRDGRYYFTDNVHLSWSIKECDEKSHLWTIQDAKDGDVLASEDKDKVFLYNGKLDLRGRVCAYCGIYKTYDGLRFTKCAIGNHFTYKEPYPATKEQRDLLFQKMKEAGYEWDAEKKELKKIEQKSSWSEEDEKMINFIVKLLPAQPLACNWLKSLKDRYNWKPSDEQMKALAEALSLAKNCGEESAFELRTLYEQLKKLMEE